MLGTCWQFYCKVLQDAAEDEKEYKILIIPMKKLS